MGEQNSKDQQIAELRDLVEMLDQEVSDLRGRIERMEVAAPSELRRLTFDAVQAAIKADPYTRFEVLADWGHGVDQFKAGAVVRADHVTHIADFCRHGLQLGLPSDQKEVIARMRAETQARHQAAVAETKLAEAATERAAAATAAANVEAIAAGASTEVPDQAPLY